MTNIEKYIFMEQVFPSQKNLLIKGGVDTHFCNTFFTSPTFLWIQFMYYIIFYSFKQDPSPCNILEKLRECDLKDMSQFLLDLLHEPNPCMLPNG